MSERVVVKPVKGGWDVYSERRISVKNTILFVKLPQAGKIMTLMFATLRCNDFQIKLNNIP